jgi:two-component system response regulator FlrC
MALPNLQKDSLEAVDEKATECLGDDLKGRECELILDALRTDNGSRKAAAERLGISPRTLRYKLARMREQGIAVPA